MGGVEANSCPRLRRIKSKIKNIAGTVECVTVLCKRVVVARSIVFAVNEFEPFTRGGRSGRDPQRGFFHA